MGIGRLVPRAVGVAVAGLAVGWETCRWVGGAAARVVILEVATDAVGRSASVHSVAMTGAAVEGRMATHELIGVVEACVVPGGVCLSMAQIAGSGEAGGGVVGITAGVEVLDVAADAIGRRAGVHTTQMAGRAVLSRVYADQAVGMVEPAPAPRRVARPVAQSAVDRETGRNVIRISSHLVVFVMAAVTVSCEVAGQLIVAMTAVATDRPVLRTDRESRGGGVVPGCGHPRDRTVAALAVGAELCPERVVLASDPVAVIAPRRSSLDDVVFVALDARHRQVASLERQQG